MHKFDFVEPTSLEMVHAALAEHGDDAKIMAGGTALMLFMRQGLVQPQVIVSLRQVPGLGLGGVVGDSYVTLGVVHDPSVPPAGEPGNVPHA